MNIGLQVVDWIIIAALTATLTTDMEDRVKVLTIEFGQAGPFVGPRLNKSHSFRDISYKAAMEIIDANDPVAIVQKLSGHC